MEIPQVFRSSILPRVDEYSREYLGLYTAYEVSEEEFVFETNADLEELKKSLENAGYNYNFLAATKKHPVFDIVDSGSFRRVPETHPDNLDKDSELYQEWSPNHCQFHIHIFEINDGSKQVSCHYELRPDLSNPKLSIDRMKSHYRPEWGETYFPSIHDTKISSLNIG
jgi:hypothetical protein